MQPGEELIIALDNLRVRLNKSGTERTKGLLDAMGGDCQFYRKSLDIFLRKDFDDLKSQVSVIYELMKGM